MDEGPRATSVSVIVPVFNERENILPLCRELLDVLGRLDRWFEILLVDDGSQDGTAEELAHVASEHSEIRVISLRRNFGQTAALQAGIDFAAGDYLVMLDGDLQNDPADIPAMLTKLDEGFDLVHGWRRARQDSWLDRKLPSQVANWIISKATGFAVNDLGCTLKAVRHDIAADLELYGEMHRFIPILAHQRGARCLEMEVNHRPRQFGKTKYGLGRIPRVILDLFTIVFLLKYLASPMKLMGRYGLVVGGAGAAFGLAATASALVGEMGLAGTLAILAGLGVIGGMQLIATGLLGEINTRIYFRSSQPRPYSIVQSAQFAAATELEPTRPKNSATRAA